jgi:hypothetical protein
MLLLSVLGLRVILRERSDRRISIRQYSKREILRCTQDDTRYYFFSSFFFSKISSDNPVFTL